jgi:hypothetical protein
MQRQTYEFVEVSDGRYQLPITLQQSNRKLAKLPGLLLMTTLAGLIVVPQIALAGYAVASPDIRAALIDHPIASIELAIALAFWICLVCWPLRAMFKALICHRRVDIRDGEVNVIDRTPFSTTAWRTPLTTYEGIALHLRSSLSGIRQEAILVHPNRAQSVILMVAEHIGDREIRELCRVLGLPRVSADRLYDFGGPSGGRKATNDLVPIAT